MNTSTASAASPLASSSFARANLAACSVVSPTAVDVDICLCEPARQNFCRGVKPTRMPSLQSAQRCTSPRKAGNNWTGRRSLSRIAAVAALGKNHVSRSHDELRRVLSSESSVRNSRACWMPRKCTSLRELWGRGSAASVPRTRKHSVQVVTVSPACPNVSAHAVLSGSFSGIPRRTPSLKLVTTQARPSRWRDLGTTNRTHTDSQSHSQTHTHTTEQRGDGNGTSMTDKYKLLTHARGTEEAIKQARGHDVRVRAGGHTR